MYAPFGGIFTNDWVNFVMSNYSGIFALIPVILTAILKLIAIFDPDVPSDKINDWIQETFYSKKPQTPPT
jgi:hypothetical protein